MTKDVRYDVPKSRKSPAPARPPTNFAPVKPVQNAVRILALLGRLERPATLTQIAQSLDINASTCLNILRTLALEGLVEVDSSIKAYTIGDRVLDLAESALVRGGVLTQLQPLMEEVAYRYAVTVSLWRLIDAERIRLVLSATGEGDIRIQMRVGQKMPRWFGAVGRIMAAHSGLTEAELEQRFQKIRWQNPIDFATYAKQVSQAKTRGWSSDDGNFARGVFSVGAPVFDRSGQVTMACSATMFKNQHSDAVIRDIAREVIAIGGTLLK